MFFETLQELHAHAVRYTSNHADQGCPVTVTGLVRHLARLAQDELDTQGGSADDHAVTVSTWHRAKGLEWPVTVLYELDSRIYDQAAMGIHVVSECAGFDLENPLADRWIRYWPYPYGGVRKNVPMLDQLAGDPATAQAQDREWCEALRVLYVGWTQARDRVVLASRTGKFAQGRLAMLNTDELPTITEPECEDVIWGGRETRLALRDGVLGSVMPPALAEPDPALPSHPIREHPPAYHVPSEAEQTGAVGESRVLGDRFEISGTHAWDHLGNAVHGFFAADRDGLSEALRLNIAVR